jgi:hypothetical protein
MLQVLREDLAQLSQVLGILEVGESIDRIGSTGGSRM